MGDNPWARSSGLSRLLGLAGLSLALISTALDRSTGSGCSVSRALSSGFDHLWRAGVGGDSAIGDGLHEGLVVGVVLIGIGSGERARASGRCRSPM